MRGPLLAVGLFALVGLASTPRAQAQIAPETTGKVETLPQPPSPHWVWTADLVLERISLLDADSGRYLGLLNGGYGPFLPMFSLKRNEIYIPATYFSRRWHGDRTDVLEIHDATTLGFLGEVVLPPKRATNAVALGHAALSDDEQFAAIFNWTTGTGLTIVDVAKRTVTAEVSTPGCSLVYAAGPRRFFSLCGDGTVFVLTIDDQGRELTRQQTPSFHDPRVDPVTEKAVRLGDQWLFVSFEGKVHGVDVSGVDLKFNEPWSLFTDDDRNAKWRVGGAQHLAIHERTGRLYSLVHRGGASTHKDSGEEVWIYDVAAKKRIERVKLCNPGLTIYGFPIEAPANWVWPFKRMPEWILDHFVPAFVTHIQVTRDDKPLLITASQVSGSLGIYDAMSGQFVRRVLPTGWTTDLLVTPWGGKAAP